MKLLIAEKPSVAADIARALKVKEKKDGYIEGEGYCISWCIGHLVSYVTPDVYSEKYKTWSLNTLPIIPEPFQTNVLEGTKKQFNILKKLMNDKRMDEVICATDAGREGELIFRLVYNQAGCSLPIKRLWISSMTEEAILEGLQKRKPGSDYEALYESAMCRAKADWLVGINSTRLFTVQYGTKLSVGRVQTPTLALIVNRQQEIDHFEPQSFYQIKASFQEGYKGLWFNDTGNRLEKLEEAQQIIDLCQGKPGKVVTVEEKEKANDRPLLFDLTELQREGNRRFGYTAQQVLDTAQSLYETHKLTTYPRTDSRYLTDDMKANIIPLLEDIKYNDKFGVLSHIDAILEKGPNIDGHVINNQKVSDHHAIIVTPLIKTYDLNKLNDRENNILKLIIMRILAVLSEKYVYQETVIISEVETEKFKTTGKKVVNLGWKAIEESYIEKKEGENEEEDQELELSEINQGKAIEVQNIDIISGKTMPPKLFTEATLLTAMENAEKYVNEKEKETEQLKAFGLGTPATRASIIEKLIAMGYIERKKKNLVPTDAGKNLIALMPETLKSPDMTGQWEFQLNSIATGNESPQKFLNEIINYVKKLVQDEKRKPCDKNCFKGIKEVIGKCPRCGKNIYENKKSFYCEGYKDTPACTFSMWKEDKFFQDKGKVLTKQMAKKLLEGKNVEVKDLKKKNGVGTYSAKISLNDTGKYVNYKMDFTTSSKK